MANWAHYISEPREKLFAQLILYYLVLGGLVFWIPSLIVIEAVDQVITSTAAFVGPSTDGSAQSLADYLASDASTEWTKDLNWYELVWSTIVVFFLCLPLTWVYRGTRRQEKTVQSVIETIMILPVVTVGIIMMVQNSLALAFSLGGIFAGVQFRSRLREIADTHYIFASIGLGLACGVGLIDFAFVMSACFCFAVYSLWHVNYASDAGRLHMSRHEAQGEASPEEALDEAEETEQVASN